jgi:long-chain acyl-CoA synthetase
MSPFYLVDKFTPEGIAPIIGSYNITTIIGVPIIFTILHKVLLKHRSLSEKIKLCITGGESISKELQLTFENDLGIEIRQGYGLTEASPIVSWNHPKIRNKLGTVGHPMEWNEVRLIEGNVDSRNKLEGEIAVKGTNVMAGYYNRPVKTAEVIQDGWLHTGDLGAIDNEGYLRITGRKKEWMIKNGLNIYPKEVERIIRHHPLVRDVHIAINTTEDNDVKYENMSAVVYTENTKRLDEPSLRKWLKENISYYKIPNEILIR